MFILALFTIAKRRKQPKCLAEDEWVKKKKWPLYTMEYYSALKTKEILSHDTTWMSLEDSILSERSLLQKDKYYVIQL